MYVNEVAVSEVPVPVASRPRSRRAVHRGGAGLAVVVILLATWVAAAAAHVSVNPKEAAQGSYTKLSFRVPNERDASTVKIAVQIPQENPITSVSVKPVPGWAAEVRKKALPTPIAKEGGDVTEVVDTITWSGGQIKAGEFQEFDVSVGPLPTTTNQLVFPAIQTYDNGEEVAWIEKPTAGGPELEHPAPVLNLTPKAGEHGATGTTVAGAGTTIVAAQEVTATPAAAASTTSSSNTVAWVGVVLGAVALIGAIGALARSGRTAS